MSQWWQSKSVRSADVAAMLPLLLRICAPFQLLSWNKLHCDSSILGPLMLSNDTVLYMYQEVLTTETFGCYTNFSATAGPGRPLTFAGDIGRLFFFFLYSFKWDLAFLDCFVNITHLCVFLDGNSPSCWESLVTTPRRQGLGGRQGSHDGDHPSGQPAGGRIGQSLN